MANRRYNESILNNKSGCETSSIVNYLWKMIGCEILRYLGGIRQTLPGCVVFATNKNIVYAWFVCYIVLMSDGYLLYKVLPSEIFAYITLSITLSWNMHCVMLHYTVPQVSRITHVNLTCKCGKL